MSRTARRTGGRGPVRGWSGGARLAMPLAGLLLLAGPRAAAAGAAPAAPDISAMSNREARALELMGGGSALTAAEQRQATAIAETGMRTAPAAWLAYDANSARLLQLLPARNLMEFARAREASRLNAELGTTQTPGLEFITAMESPIIRAHDPTVAFVSPNLVTRVSLVALAEATTWIAKKVGLPPPPGDFAEAAREPIARNFASYPATLQAAYANIGRNTAAGTAFLNEVDSRKAAAFLKARVEATPPGASQPGALAALVMQDLYNETVRRHWHPMDAGKMAHLYEQMISDKIMLMRAQSMRNAFYGTNDLPR